MLFAINTDDAQPHMAAATIQTISVCLL